MDSVGTGEMGVRLEIPFPNRSSISANFAVARHKRAIVVVPLSSRHCPAPYVCGSRVNPGTEISAEKKGKVMVGPNFPVDSIDQLAGTIRTQTANLEGTLNSLRAQCQRDPNFMGNAASKYDEYLSHWDASQKTMVESLNGAASLLAQLAAQLRTDDQTAANAFNLSLWT